MLKKSSESHQFSEIIKTSIMEITHVGQNIIYHSAPVLGLYYVDLSFTPVQLEYIE